MVKKSFDKKRPLSWSAISSFEYDPEQWYRKYVLNEKGVETAAMTFGKQVAQAIEAGLAPRDLTVLRECEHELRCEFDGIPLIGFIDTYDPGKRLGEFKTGKRPWDQKRVDGHGQIDMYLLMLWIRDGIRPESMDVFLEWMPTQDNGDFTVSFLGDEVHHFPTKRTMQDILRFGARIKKTIKEMDRYCRNHE